MLRAAADHPLSKSFTVTDGDREVARIRLGWFSDNAEAMVGGRTIQLRRRRLFSGPFEIEVDGKVLARAEKPSVFRNRFELDIAGVRVVLVRESWFSRSFVLRKREEEVGRIDRDRIIKRTARIDLPQEWPVALQVFVLWLVLIIWKRMDSA